METLWCAGSGAERGMTLEDVLVDEGVCELAIWIVLPGQRAEIAQPGVARLQRQPWAW